MASSTIYALLLTVSLSVSLVSPGTVIEDLNNLKPPPDFNSTIAENCQTNPFHRYCNATPDDLHEVFKSTIVASHLCNVSKNPNCVETFSKIDLHNQRNAAKLYLSFTFFWKYCPLSITTIDLSNNSIQGNFPSDIFYCSQIQALDLRLNGLSGDVPIQNFSTLSNLTFLNLSYNYFSEVKFHNEQFFSRFNSSSFISSGILPDHKEFKMKAVFLLFGFPVLVIVMVTGLGWLCFWRPDFLPRFLRRKHKFTPSMLRAATDGFSRKNLVERTEEVSIYNGQLRDGNEVRIEMYKETISRKNHKKFVQECKILVQLSHKNLIQVMGWCQNRRMRAVVTEWIDGDHVETWLSVTAPPWNKRRKVIRGVIEAIYYLHEEWPEITCDLKTTSILICEDGEPVLSRFKVDTHKSKVQEKSSNYVYPEMVTNKRAQF
ncbi:hypothetical protein Leryth_014402 [Lithospermum erythrorhizon]|nr:hypothetical protein Leryth_014402 [Lithospermum erythrorhizon]